MSPGRCFWNYNPGTIKIYSNSLGNAVSQGVIKSYDAVSTWKEYENQYAEI